MGSPYVGEIRMFGGNFAPAGWMFCEGQLLPISEYDTLFNLIGTTYGGDGQSTFALPDLRGRLPLHLGSDPNGNTYTLGQNGGAESVTLTTQQIPAHTHVPQAQSSNGSQASPANNLWAASPLNQFSSATPASADAFASSIGLTGGSQPHDNFQPYLCVDFIISLFGAFPVQ